MANAQGLVESIWARVSKEASPGTDGPQRVGCGSRETSPCGNGLEKVYPTTVVRYGYMNHVGEFAHEPDMLFSCGGSVVIRSERGIELGRQVSLSCTGCSKSVSREQIRRYVENSGPEFLRLNAGEILREATASDLMENQHLVNTAFDRIRTCTQLADECGLDIELVASEHLLGGERIIFYFMAEGRVDFRELVRRLAGEYHTRIEMRQVGARDEARLIADYETCGRECCCKNFLKTLRPVNMKMAKMQKTTLDPSKVSGRCGRLKCCLRYEHETYEELDRRLPRLGRFVRTAHGEGVVVDRQILTQLVQFRTPDERLMTVAIEDVRESLDAPPGGAPGRAPADEAEERWEENDLPDSDEESASASRETSTPDSDTDGPEPLGRADDLPTTDDADPARRPSRGRRSRRRGRRRPGRPHGGTDSRAGEES